MIRPTDNETGTISERGANNDTGATAEAGAAGTLFDEFRHGTQRDKHVQINVPHEID